MCGIAGAFSKEPRSADDLRRSALAMTGAIAHRGPDGEGVWLDEACGVALGHRRLAIIDLTETGAQPMASRSGRYVLTYNGEIYNFETIRTELEAREPGRAWRGRSDTEVALAAIETWGLETALGSFNGMFALALWDREARTLSLARDRFGEKPLYYAIEGGTLWFASELRALRQVMDLGEADIDLESLEWLFRTSYIPAPRSIFRGVHKLEPASWTTFTADDVANGRAGAAGLYWDMRAEARRAAADPFAGGEAAAAERLAELLGQSIAPRLVADVPVGAMLSGGVDSASVCAIAQAHAGGPLKTFTVGFEAGAYDESQAAGEVAARLGTDHTTLFVGPGEVLAAVPKMAQIYDEPFADSSQIPTFLVARALRGAVTVALSGDGGDELFGGYTRYFAGPRLWNALSAIPRPVRSAAARAVDLAGRSRVARLVATAGGRDAQGAAHVHKALGLLDAGSRDDFFERLTTHWPADGNISSFDGPIQRRSGDKMESPAKLEFARRMMLEDTGAYLPDDILTKVDRASMAVALEVRVPFLDPALFAFAWSLPTSVLIRDGVGKRPLRRLLGGFLPPALAKRRKQGFAVPLDDLLRGALRPWADDLLACRRSPDAFYRPQKVRQAWREHRQGGANNAAKLWPILMFEAWRDTL